MDASNVFEWVHDIEGLSVLQSEVVVVTADGADHPLYDRVAPLLQRIRGALALDVVFVAQLVAGRPALRDALSRDPAQAIVAEQADPLEADFGRRQLQDRGESGDILALPVAGKDGFEYGTVCCRASAEPGALYSVARLVALSLSSWNRARPVDVWASSAAAPLLAEPALS